MLNAKENSCLVELADLIEKYDVRFDYTIADDGIHIHIAGKDDCFVGFYLDPAELRKAANA